MRHYFILTYTDSDGENRIVSHRTSESPTDAEILQLVKLYELFTTNVLKQYKQN